MAQEAAFVDASPLIGLACVDGLVWLPQLYGAAFITRAVRDEVLPGRELPGESAIRSALRRKHLRLFTRDLAEPEFADLDAGEASTLRAALRHGEGAIVVIDDLAARQAAGALRLAFTGTAGVILEAKRSGLIEAARPVFERLAQTNFRLSSQIVEEILTQLGER
ncbi:MAG: DUF3368 domain-containing protein [Betaproteobacteria bacterium]|nr:DUF3368 domain-containing protein [Betaproteobacteria bacterium]